MESIVISGCRSWQGLSSELAELRLRAETGDGGESAPLVTS